MERQYSPIWTFLWLSLVSVMATFCAFLWFNVSGLSLLALFMGLEGTVSLASALSPATAELRAACHHRGARRLAWWMFESWKYRSPVSYNPALFYLGLLLLSTSLFLSSLN
jgi:hypothetical protein